MDQVRIVRVAHALGFAMGARVEENFVILCQTGVDQRIEVKEVAKRRLCAGITLGEETAKLPLFFEYGSGVRQCSNSELQARARTLALNRSI